MFWPLRKSKRTPSAIRPASHVEKDSIYVSRPRLESGLAAALERGDNLVVYGPAHQGKTLLLSRHLPSDSIVIECRPDFKRTQIYRVILSSLGYAVLVEKKRTGKASATMKFGFSPIGGEANAEGGIEQTMQAVTVDLKNPSEVALLLSRIKNLPWIVLNNFQLLDGGTKSTLLFDLATFSERPSMRFIVVGAWPSEEYLEVIEPAIAGKFKYLQVPAWSDKELRDAAAQWTSRIPELRGLSKHVDDFVSMASGDISLFRSLAESSGLNPEAQQGGSSVSAAIQDIVLGRFRRGFGTKLQALLAERDSYVGYLGLQPTITMGLNPKFVPIPDVSDSAYLRTSINPQTNRPYQSGGEVRLDRAGNPQYIEVESSKVESMQLNLTAYLLRMFHAAVQEKSNKIEISDLEKDFLDTVDPAPIEVLPSRLRAAFIRFVEAQREALIVPAMLSLDASSRALEISDQRLFLFLQSLSREDLDEMLDSAQPRMMPRPRRRNQLSSEMTESEKTAYVASLDEEPSPERESQISPQSGQE